MEPERLPEPTGGSTDVVHLLKYASLFFGWLSKTYKVLEAKSTNLKKCTNFVFCLFFVWIEIFNQVFLRHNLHKYGCFCAYWKDNFLNFSKLTLLFIIIHSHELQRALKWKKIFLEGGHPLAPPLQICIFCF